MGDDLYLLLFTLGTAALATLLILPAGILAGAGLARWRGPGSGLVETVLSLPLVLPPTAVGLVLLELLGRNGVLGGALEAVGFEVVFTWKAVVLASAVMAFPLLVRSARSAFEEVDPRLAGISRTLGWGPASTFLRVSLPLAWRGVMAGTVLAFSRALGEFGATILVAGNIPGRTQTMALAIFQRVQLGEDSSAFRLVALTTLLSFAAIWTTELVTRTRRRSPFTPSPSAGSGQASRGAP
ncbi:MAG: molybdate ABC transporter permease subunit [Myxococcaceae bacterium]